MHEPSRQYGFTLVEVLIVVVIMMLLAGTVLSQLADTTQDAKESTAEVNVHSLRNLIELYRSQHQGRVPSSDLHELMLLTNAEGAGGTGPDFIYGPYLNQVPVNPFTGSSRIRTTSTNPPTAPSGTDDAGWLYHPVSGNIWLDNPDHL